MIQFLEINIMHWEHFSEKGVPESKLTLTKAFKTQIKDIIFNRIIDKKEYLSTKRSIDLAMQSILIDLCDIVFDRNSRDKYNYDKLLHMSTESLIKVLLHKQFLGFFLYRNIEINIDDFVNLFNDKFRNLFLWVIMLEQRKINQFKRTSKINAKISE